MAVHTIRGGEQIDIPTADETAAVTMDRMRAFWAEQQEISDAREREKARGLKRIEVMIPFSASPTTTFVGNTVPEEGYVWSVKLVSAILGGSGTFAVYKASASGDTRRLLGQTTSISVNGVNQAAVTWGSDQARLKHGEGLYLTAGAAMLSMYLAGWETPSELEYKLLLWPDMRSAAGQRSSR